MVEITVHDVLRAMGHSDLERESVWAIGKAAQVEYSKLNDGELPPKKLRRKRNGKGSHCFAVYPANYESLIRHIIAMHVTGEEKQGDMFRDGSAAA